jgi:quercetin 2,3-dioxygenase
VLCRAEDRFVTTAPGRTSWHAFSFGEHYDPGRIGAGALTVCNTELVHTDHGYPDHPHRDTEIVTWVMEGSLRHTDSSGSSGIVHPGLAQRMSAGSGIVHAEMNDAYRLDPSRPPRPVRFVQMWLRPDLPGGCPGQAQRELSISDLAEHLVPVASGRHPDAAVGLGTADATLWATRLAPGARRRLPGTGRTFLVVVRGVVDLEGVGLLRTDDSVELVGHGGASLSGVADAEVLIWELGR